MTHFQCDRSGPCINTRRGHAIDLLNPSPSDVDFGEIAETLAHVYRWTGAAQPDVSVAWHTFIGVEVAKWKGLEWLIPYWLLHDAHEARLGDIATPVAHALDQAVALTLTAPHLEGSLRYALRWLKTQHDAAIHTAARLAMPDEAMQADIKHIDLICLMTERRDYLADCPRKWPEELEAIPCLTHSLSRPPPPAICAEKLLTLFKQHLPVFTGENVQLEKEKR